MLNGELTEQLVINELKSTLKIHCNMMHRYVGSVHVIKIIYSCVIVVNLNIIICNRMEVVVRMW